MKRNNLIIFLILTMFAVNLMTINVFAEIVEPESNIGITPYYTTIVLCSNNLTLNSGGKLNCEGKTNVQRGYMAGVKMELQELSNSWTTIKTWDSTSDGREMYISKDWYVARGTYRLKLTHTAIDSSDKIVETVIKYSKTVIY